MWVNKMIQQTTPKGAGRYLRIAIFLVAAMATPLFSQPVWAQNQHDFGSWFSANTQGPLGQYRNPDSRWKWWFDGHLRYLTDSGGFHQSIIRPGIGYALNERTTLWAGYGWINELPVNGRPIFDENRFWQQLIWTHPVGCGKYMSRTRLEQRFRNNSDEAGWRLRQFCKWTRPIDCNDRCSWVLWDEMFFDLNETDWGQIGSFSQNRVFAGMGINLNGPNRPRIEIGYLNQYVRNPVDDDRYNHIVSANWFWTF